MFDLQNDMNFKKCKIWHESRKLQPSFYASITETNKSQQDVKCGQYTMDEILYNCLQFNSFLRQTIFSIFDNDINLNSIELWEN